MLSLSQSCVDMHTKYVIAFVNGDLGSHFEMQNILTIIKHVSVTLVEYGDSIRKQQLWLHGGAALRALGGRGPGGCEWIYNIIPLNLLTWHCNCRQRLLLLLRAASMGV